MRCCFLSSCCISSKSACWTSCCAACYESSMVSEFRSRSQLKLVLRLIVCNSQKLHFGRKQTQPSCAACEGLSNDTLNHVNPTCWSRFVSACDESSNFKKLNHNLRKTRGQSCDNYAGFSAILISLACLLLHVLVLVRWSACVQWQV